MMRVECVICYLRKPHSTPWSSHLTLARLPNSICTLTASDGPKRRASEEEETSTVRLCSSRRSTAVTRFSEVVHQHQRCRDRRHVLRYISSVTSFFFFFELPRASRHRSNCSSLDLSACDLPSPMKGDLRKSERTLHAENKLPLLFHDVDICSCFTVACDHP